jgi:signal transduction histidine kinase
MAVASGAVVVISIAILVVVSVGLLREATDEVVRDIQTLDVVERLEGNLLYYVQISNIYVAEPSPVTAAMRNTMQARIEELEASLETLSGSEAERVAVRRAQEDIAEYFRLRAAAEASEDKLRDIVTRSTPSLNEALRAVDDLRRVNTEQLEASYARDARLRRLSTLAGVGAVAVVLAGVIGFVLFLRRELIHPLLALTRAAAAFRAGDLEARAPERGPRELRDVARALNDTGAALAEQRRSRLTFLASVAHDLRTPLQALKTSVELLRAEPDLAARPLVTGVVDRIDRQSERLLVMANDLGDASQIEAGELSLSTQPLDLREPVRNVVELYRPTTARHAIDLTVPDEPVIIEADVVRIEQVAGNLLSNAIKYSPEGGPIRVEIEARVDRAVLSVADQGLGIEPEAIDQLFLPFRRGKRSSHLVTGSGLGLSVSKHIVAAHGGTIAVTSKPGAGAIFRVTLPRSAPSGAEASSKREGAKTEATERAVTARSGGP